MGTSSRSATTPPWPRSGSEGAWQSAVPEVRAGLQVRGHAADTPIEDDGGLRSVLRRHGARLGAVQSPEEDGGLDEVGDPPTPSRGIHSLRGRIDLWLAFFCLRSSAAKPSLFEPAPWYRSTDW